MRRRDVLGGLLLVVLGAAGAGRAGGQDGPQAKGRTMMYSDTVSGRPFAKDPAVVRFQGRYWLYYSLCPFLFQDDDGRDYLFFQGNNTGGRTWFLSMVPIAWEAGKPVLRAP